MNKNTSSSSYKNGANVQVQCAMVDQWHRSEQLTDSHAKIATHAYTTFIAQLLLPALLDDYKIPSITEQLIQKTEESNGYANQDEMKAKVKDIRESTLGILHNFWSHKAQIDKHTFLEVHFDP
jgi:hypothetical protein